MLIGDDGDVRLADFGIASLVAEPTISNTGQLLGTAAYISPEQARGLPATEASDRYALAVTAFELLTGRRPFPGEHFAAQARAHIEQSPPRASDHRNGLPRAVDHVLQRGMAKEAVDRWPTALDFTRALRDALEHAPARAHAFAPPALAFAVPKAPRGERSPRERRPGHGARVPALAALLLAVLTTFIVVESNSGPPVAASSLLRQAAIRVSTANTRAAAGDAALSAGRIADGLAKAGSIAAAVHRTAPKPAPQAPAATATTSAPPAEATNAPPTGAGALEAQGHSLMEAGNYSQALPVLRQAVQTADPTSLTYAYALFDLGRTLRLAGDPAAAIPVLEARLRIPNQPGIVAAELHMAQQQAGQAAPPPAPAGPGDGHGHAYGHVKHGLNVSGQGDQQD
jgi:serine/threonine-protein kinase